MPITEDPDTKNAVAPDDPEHPGEDRTPRRFALRLARVVRHLDAVSKWSERLDSLMNTLLLIKRPRWIDRTIIGARAVSAIVDEADTRLHHEVDRAGTAAWPCMGIYTSALRPYYRGTFFAYTAWYRVSYEGRKVDVVLSTRHQHIVYVDGPPDALAAAVWEALGPIVELRGAESDIQAEPGAHLDGYPSPVAAKLAAEFASGERRSAILLGPPGFGKSHAVEQIAAVEAARRGAGAGRAGRILRLPAAASVTTAALRGVLKHLRPDALVVHDVDTDAPSPATLLRVVEQAHDLGVAVLCTANSIDGMHAAAFGDHRFGTPVRVDAAPEEVVRAVLGPWCSAVQAAPGDAWGRMAKSSLATVARARRALDAGRTIDEALGPEA